MIIHSDVQIKDYLKTVLDKESGFHGGEASKGMFRCQNPECRCNTFHRHGTYERYFEALPEVFPVNGLPEAENPLSCFDSIQTCRLTILRIKCSGCGQTHAVLPCDVVPFHLLSLFLQLMILVQLYSSSQKCVLRQTEVLSWPLLCALLTVYRSYRAHMIHALRVKNIYTSQNAPSDMRLLHIYTSPDPPATARYREVFSSQLFVTRRSTVSYPVRIMIC